MRRQARSAASAPKLTPVIDRVGAQDSNAAAPGLDEKCVDLHAAFEKQKAQGGRCAEPADCACYPDLRIDGARRVSDAATARTLTEISNEYRRRQCPTIWAEGPPPRPCTPACRDGACTLP